MAKTMHSDYGAVSERLFPATAVTDAVRTQLKALKSAGVLRHFQLDGSGLHIWRPWVEGNSLEERFSANTNRNGRFGSSRAVFAQVWDLLSEAGGDHGALHPRNILFSQDGTFVLVDRLTNGSRLGPWTEAHNNPWLWGPCPADDLLSEEWDRVSLLRTVALLWAGPEAWSNPGSAEQVAGLCHTWADEVNDSTGKGNLILPRVQKALSLLDRIVHATYSRAESSAPPPFAVEEELEALRARQGDLRILRREDENGLKRRARERGLREEVELDLSAWLVQRDFRREAEIEELARELLGLGQIPGTHLVASHARAAAEAAWKHFGMAREDAQLHVTALLATQGWLDEDHELAACQARLGPASWTPPLAPQVGELAKDLAKVRKMDLADARYLIELAMQHRWLDTDEAASP